MKLFNDTLKNNGRWSRKSLTMFVSFMMAIFTGIYIVISDYLAVTINEYAVEVFRGFMFLAGALAGITVADKFTGAGKNKDGKPQQEQIED